VVQLAQAYIRSGSLELAEQTLRQAVQSNPRDPRARLALAQFLVNKGEAAKARTVLEQLVKDEPGNVEGQSALARLLLVTNEPAAALEVAATIQALQPKSATGYYLAGLAQQAQGRTEDARRALEAAAAADPGALEPLAALAQLDVAGGDAERALARVDARLAARPEDATLHNLRGDLLMTMRRHAEAATSYAAAIKARPAWPLPYRGQAAALLASGQRERAVEVLRAGLAATGQASVIAADLGTLFMSTSRWDDAIAVFEQMHQRDPSNLIVANNLAMLLVTHRPDAASLERADKLSEPLGATDNPVFLDTRGWVLYRRGRHAEALPLLEKAVAKLPDAPELRYHLGMAQLAAGQTAAARANLEAAVRSDERYLGFDEARKALAGL
jgi:tetratricopeptide (TPR) repeat protein